MRARLLHARAEAAQHDPRPLARAARIRVLRDRKGDEDRQVRVLRRGVGGKNGRRARHGALRDGKKGIFTVACGTGIIGITALVPEGKGKMSAGDFIRGRKIAAGDRFIRT